MASTPTYLPVYSLSEMQSPTTDDYLVVQSAAANGDVALLPISTLISAFFQEYMDDTEIDSSTTTLYASMGWEAPT